jgi:sugar lactone lactonase YvrE
MTPIGPHGALTPFVQGLAFPEGPRWHEGRLWCSDIADGKVLRIGEDSATEVVVEGLRRPSGLGWLPDGRLLVVEGETRRLLRRDGARWVTHADLSALVSFSLNEMVVDASGRAYVGNWGFDFEAHARPAPTVLVVVEPEGAARVVADGLVFPNGSVITPDGATLLVAETHAGRISAFERRTDGSLHGHRAWATLERAWPDGICLDAEGAVWLASPPTQEVVRVHAGGAIVQRVPTPGDAVACMLGGADRRTLFVLSTRLIERDAPGRPFNGPQRLRELRAGRIDTMRVEVSGAGWP